MTKMGNMASMIRMNGILIGRGRLKTTPDEMQFGCRVRIFTFVDVSHFVYVRSTMHGDVVEHDSTKAKKK